MNDTNEHCIKNNVCNKYQGYLVDGVEVTHLYDIPHLIKGIRNGLLEKDLHCVINGKKHIASWSHITKLYEIDLKQGLFYSQCNKLSDEHVLPQKIKKMKVKNCTQVFSHTVGTAMHARAKTSLELSVSSEFYINLLEKTFEQLFQLNLNILHFGNVLCYSRSTKTSYHFFNKKLDILIEKFCLYMENFAR